MKKQRTAEEINKKYFIDQVITAPIKHLDRICHFTLFSPTALEVFDVSSTSEILPVSRGHRVRRHASGNDSIPDN